MDYTVKGISELSGVSKRTLHYYEEAGLIEPAYYGSNGYRYYGRKELLRLQQILFFKELGLTLKQIRKVLGQSGFDVLAALYSHKRALQRDWERKGKLLETVGQTIEYLKGNSSMKDKEFFNGFDLVKKGKGTEPYFAAEEVVLKHLRTVESPDREAISREAAAILAEIGRLADLGLAPDAERVQTAVRKHHAFADKFHVATKRVYEALAELYRTHPAFRGQLDAIHPKLAGFMPKAMETFAKRL